MQPLTPPAVDLKRITFPGKIHLIRSDKELNEVEKVFSEVTALGFDTETKPSFKKGDVFKVALLQLATEHDAYLIRLHGLTHFDFLKSVFENEKILKVGLAIRDDIKQLQKIFSFTPKNFKELQEIAKTKGLQNFGLKGMAAEVLQAALSKGPKLTNWEAQILTEAQMMYAATDAWIGLQLYKKLEPTLA